MTKNHIKKIKPNKPFHLSVFSNLIKGAQSKSVIKTRDTGIACIPTGNPPDSVF